MQQHGVPQRSSHAQLAEQPVSACSLECINLSGIRPSLLFFLTSFSSTLQEAITRVCSSTAHYSAARMLSGTEQQLFQSAARALCDLVTPYTVSCYRCVYPEVTAKMDVNQATKALRDVIQAWEQEQGQATYIRTYTMTHTSWAIEPKPSEPKGLARFV